MRFSHVFQIEGVGLYISIFSSPLSYSVPSAFSGELFLSYLPECSCQRCAEFHYISRMICVRFRRFQNLQVHPSYRLRLQFHMRLLIQCPNALFISRIAAKSGCAANLINIHKSLHYWGLFNYSIDSITSSNYDTRRVYPISFLSANLIHKAFHFFLVRK